MVLEALTMLKHRAIDPIRMSWAKRLVSACSVRLTAEYSGHRGVAEAVRDTNALCAISVQVGLAALADGSTVYRKQR